MIKYWWTRDLGMWDQPKGVPHGGKTSLKTHVLLLQWMQNWQSTQKCILVHNRPRPGCHFFGPGLLHLCLHRSPSCQAPLLLPCSTARGIFYTCTSYQFTLFLKTLQQHPVAHSGKSKFLTRTYERFLRIQWFLPGPTSEPQDLYLGFPPIWPFLCYWNLPNSSPSELFAVCPF